MAFPNWELADGSEATFGLVTKLHEMFVVRDKPLRSFAQICFASLCVFPP
jgi:hypothetical protein